MKASLFALAGLVAAVAAGSKHEHHHELHKGYPMAPPPGPPPPAAPSAANAACGCTTSWSTWYGEATLVQPAPAPETYSAAPAPVASSYSAAPAPAKSTYSAAPAPSPYSTSPGYAGSGKHWAITYSPYQGESAASSSCKSASQVMSDIGTIAARNFSTVRIYATDCNQVENVAAACKQHGLKMILGVFIKSAGICQDSYDQLNDIVNYFHGNYEMVELIVIGNEAMFNGYCSGSELAGFISHCKSTLKSAGYTGPVTTTDTVAAFQSNAGAICPVIDVVGANIYSFFNGNTAPEDSGNFIAGQMSMLQHACPNKEVYNLECGWPTQGPNYMNAVPSPENQAKFIQSVMEADSCGHTVFFASSNDGWKNDGSPSVEPYFGCLDQFSD